MASATSRADYRVRPADPKTAGPTVPAGDTAAVDFLQLLGRAARQMGTYPATSPLCTDAIDACHRSFAGLDTRPLTVRVAPRELIVNDTRIGRGGAIEQDLARPLHRARVASLEIDHAASPRDWFHFCAALVACNRPAKTKTTFAELLLEAGVASIVVRMVPRPEVFEFGAPPPSVRHLVDRERAREQPRSGGTVQYFYPPDKGWIRVDPTIQYDSVSLLDLAVLVNEPTELAAILMRLTDDDGDEGVRPEAALEQKYGDVVTLISALNPGLARVLFAKLARAVLDLDMSRRQVLLRRSILPRLLDGRADGEAVLSEFPDVDLAEALCLLLDLETAAPELLPTAIDRLHLASERRATVVPLIKARLDAGPSEVKAGRRADAELTRYADALIRVDSTIGRSFEEFAAFDLSMNAETAAALGSIRGAIETTDPVHARLACLSRLTQLEPNPAVVGAFMERSLDGLRDLVRTSRWAEFSSWLSGFMAIASALESKRPDVAEAVRGLSARLCTRELILAVADLNAQADRQRETRAIVAALGRSIVPAWLQALESAADRTRLGPLMPLLAVHARELAPAVARSLSGCGPDALGVAVALLGSAGAGYEAAIAGQLARCHERSGREALRALARIGTNRAAAVVVEQIENGPPWAAAAAEEALWRLPAAVAQAAARDLLGRRRFVVRHPEPAARLIGRLAQTNNDALNPMLENLASLRYYFWNPAVARIGVKARELLR